MVRHYKDLMLRRPESPRAKKSLLEEGKKRKPPTEQIKEQTPLPELEARKKSEVSKKLKVQKMSEVPKLKGIIIRSTPREQKKTPPAQWKARE